MRVCAVAQHDPPRLRQLLPAVSCDSFVFQADSIVPRILRFLYVSLQKRNLRGISISMTQLCPTARFFQSFSLFHLPGQPTVRILLRFRPSIIVSIDVQAL